MDKLPQTVQQKIAEEYQAILDKGLNPYLVSVFELYTIEELCKDSRPLETAITLWKKQNSSLT